MLENENYGVEELDIKDIEAFLSSEEEVTPPVTDEKKIPPETQLGDDVEKQKAIENTKAFAHRLRKKTEEAVLTERESIAKKAGYENYSLMQKALEDNMFKEKGLNPEEVAPVIEEIIKKRLEEDPRLKELEGYRQKKIEEWAKKELIELNTLTGGKISKMEDIPKNVIELWKTKGSLKAAYLELEGERLIKEMQTDGQNKSSTNHLNSPEGTPQFKIDNNKRLMTPKEKEIYKMFNPDVTEAEMVKILKDK